jgi:hypothetical protein
MAESSDVVRTFIAIPLPDAVKRFLSDIQSELKSAGWLAAWPNPERFHLTLKFFLNQRFQIQIGFHMFFQMIVILVFFNGCVN